MQLFAKAPDIFPDAHGVQPEEPTPEKVPAGHEMQDPGEFGYVPAEQPCGAGGSKEGLEITVRNGAGICVNMNDRC